MNIDLGGFEHEIVSTIIAFVGGALWRKAVRLGKDLNCLWPRLRQLEADNRRLKKALGLPDAAPPPDEPPS
jgi:hypothetical protein